jgi:hypothetical protein
LTELKSALGASGSVDALRLPAWERVPGASTSFLQLFAENQNLWYREFLKTIFVLLQSPWS